LLLGRALCRRKVVAARDYFSIRRPIDTRKKDSGSERMPEEAILKIFSRYRKGPKQGAPDPTCSDKAKYAALKFRFEYRSWLNRKLGTIPYNNCEKNRFHLQKWNYGEGLKISPLRVWSVIFARCWLCRAIASRHSRRPRRKPTNLVWAGESNIWAQVRGASAPRTPLFLVLGVFYRLLSNKNAAQSCLPDLASSFRTNFVNSSRNVPPTRRKIFSWEQSGLCWGNTPHF